MGLGVVDAYLYLVAGLTCHRILVRHHSGAACRDIDLRVGGDHRLVHAVERQPVAFGAPESAFLDTEFVAVHAFAIDDVEATIVAHLCDLSIRGLNVKVVVFGVGGVFRLWLEVGVGSRGGVDHAPDDAFVLPVHEHLFAEMLNHHLRLVGIWERSIVEASQGCGGLKNAVDLIECEKGGVLTCLIVDNADLVQVQFHTVVAPPCHVFPRRCM